MTSLAFKSFDEEIQKLPISAFIIALNEEDKIRACLQSLAFCSEIIVVDSGSTDRTRQIAIECGATVLPHEFIDYSQQKQWALEQCTNDWVISLDADERVTSELYDFLKAYNWKESSIDGFEVKRRHYFLNTWIKASGLYPDYKLRVFKREKAKFSGEGIHEVVELDGKVEKLPYDILHYSWTSIKDYLSRQLNYAEKVAKNKFKQNKSTSPFEALWRGVFTFLYRYFVRCGFLDGAVGLIICFGAAVATSYKYFHLWELNLKYSNESRFPKTFLLKPFQLIYACAVALRNKLYAKSILKKYKAQVPVISVGNLTVGGSGKTSFVIWLARHLSTIRQNNLAVLTRGYRSQVKGENLCVVNSLSTASEVGDEPLLIYNSLPKEQACVVVSPNRVKAAEHVVRELGSQILLLDDGFQHQKLIRDRNICLIDCSDPNIFELLPIGSLRENWSSLQRTDLVVLTRAENNFYLKQKILEQIVKVSPDLPVFEMRESVSKFTQGISKLEEYPHGKKVVAFCGLGNPQQFFNLLEREGLKIVKTFAFPDHFEYSEKTVEMLQRVLAETEADCLVTTSKDAIKVCLANDGFRPLVCHLKIEVFDEKGLTIDSSIHLSNLIGSEIFENLIQSGAKEIG